MAMNKDHDIYRNPYALMRTCLDRRDQTIEDNADESILGRRTL